ncbi:hypothetical protein [Kitasatospora sp. NPDC059803]|uniref:hypothetical protein n=1 Tax=Kitasatospora sp. NPDC059803 TaxID=3346953 RepID=UPI003666B8E5
MRTGRYVLALSAAAVAITVAGLTAPPGTFDSHASAQARAAAAAAEQDLALSNGQADVQLTGRANLTLDQAGIQENQKGGDTTGLVEDETHCSGAGGTANLMPDGSLTGTVSCQDDVVFTPTDEAGADNGTTGQQVEVTQMTENLATGEVDVTLDGQKVPLLTCPDRSSDVTVSGSSATTDDVGCDVTPGAADTFNKKFGVSVFEPGDEIAHGTGSATAKTTTK